MFKLALRFQKHAKRTSVRHLEEPIQTKTFGLSEFFFVVLIPISDNDL